MRDLKCVRLLLAAADRDIEILQLMYDSTGGSDEIFGFHAQQAAEKSLKAWLAFLGEVYPLTHDPSDRNTRGWPRLDQYEHVHSTCRTRLRFGRW